MGMKKDELCQGGGQTRDETGDDDEYRPTVAEVEAAAAEDSASGAGGDADVEEEGAGRNAREHGGDNGRGGRGRGGRGGGRVGRGQGRSSARAQAVGNAGGHSGGHASGPPVDGRGGGRVGRVAHSAARAGRGGSGGGRAAEAAPDPGPGIAPTQRSDGVGSTPLRAGGISRGGGTAGSRGRASKRQRKEDLPKDSVVEGLAGKHYPGLLVGMFGELEDGCRPCRVCGDVMGWDGGSTGTGWKHVKRVHYPNVQIWVRRFLDPAKPKDLEFPWGGYGVSGDGPPVPNPHGGAWEHAAAWPNIPAAVAAAGSGAWGGGEWESLREKLDKIRLSDVHWDALVELKNFLQPFHSITKVAEASLYPTAAAVVPLYNQLLDKMEITYREPAVSPLTQALITKALGKLKKYPYGTKEELAIATFLDPRYKTIFFQMPQWEALNAAQVTEVGGCARSVHGVDESTVMRLVRDRLVAYQERVRSRGGGGEVTSGMGEVPDGAGVSVQAAGTSRAAGSGGALMAIKSWMAQNTSGRSLNVAGAARSLVELCYEAEDDGF
ncbi:unnamed protein product [Closterium sp. NIES-64]|nr:unnamed protein product [Closterium sp. NIES-64]